LFVVILSPDLREKVGDIIKVQELQMKKDAYDYLSTIKKAGKSGIMGESENGIETFFNAATSFDVKAKRDALRQKYKGDDFVKFCEVLKAAVKVELKIGDEEEDKIGLNLLGIAN
jgi:hypothetical protein